MTRLALVTVILFPLVVPGFSKASELLPADRPLAEVVDHYVSQKLRDAKVEPAAAADDATIIRRLTLDLAGRIPTAAEAQSYVASTDPEKKAGLVERLIDSDAYARHQANEFDAFLMADMNASLRDYLLTAFQEGRGWDQIFREVVIADQLSEAKAAAEFVKRRAKDADKLANDVSVMFFGVNVSCAKCHDHPLVAEWTQDHFYGMKSFFSRTFENGDFIGERDYGVVKFKTTDGDEKTAKPMLLSGAIVDEPESAEPTAEEKKKEKELLEKLKKDKQPPPPPKYSRRAQLAEAGLQAADREYFSRAIVNRLWYRLFGHGLVMPIDQMHPENEPSHPQLLQWLARDLQNHDYDLTRLVRGLVLSDAYARTSRWAGDARPRPDLFAVAAVRPLTPHQYATSLRLAVRSPARFSGDVSGDEVTSRIASVENGARSLANQFDQPGENFQVSVTEALMLSNNEKVTNELLRDAGDSLVGDLKTLDEPQRAVETAAWNVLTRELTEDERRLLTDFFVGQGDDRLTASRQLVWSLLTSSELRFNY